ncbi:34677_t:CDS:1, partial [Racocetra persica]
HCSYPYDDPRPRMFYYGESNIPIGPMEHYTLAPNDIGFIRISNPDNMLKPNIQNTPTGAHIEYFIIGSIEIINSGVHICKAGTATSVTCGRVKALNVNVGSQTGVKVGLIAASVFSGPKDSGGSMFHYVY